MNESDRQFMIAGNLPIKIRYGLIFGLAIAGFTLQMQVNIILGLFFLLVTTLFYLTKQIDSKPVLKGSSEWKTATMDEFQKVQELFNAADNFKQQNGGFTLTTAKGCGGCFLFCSFIVVGAFILNALAPASSDTDLFEPITKGGPLAVLFVLDALALVAPLWLFGSIKTWEPPELRKRMGQLDFIYQQTKDCKDLDFSPNLLINKTDKGDVPIECKLTVNIKEAPEGFLGIQVQTSLNSVQGTTYPYTYCVLVAKPELGLLSKAKLIIEHPPTGGFRTSFLATDNEKKEAKFARYFEALIELKKEKDVEIAVIRQNTKGVGYKTSPAEGYRVFTVAYDLAKKILR